MNRHKLGKILDDIVTNIILFNPSGIWLLDSLRYVISIIFFILLLVVGGIINWIRNFLWWIWYDIKKILKNKPE